MDAAAHCERLVREEDRDRYLSILFAPAAHRPHLFSLAAFNLEVARIRSVVSQPTAGEIRLQWWREAIEGKRPEEAAAHPVASALIETIREFRLPTGAFDSLLEARIADLYDDPVATIGDLEGYAGETRSVLIQLGAMILGKGDDALPGDAAGHGGVAWTLMEILRSIGESAARGQILIPAEILARHGAAREDILAGHMTDALSTALEELRSHASAHHTRAWQAVTHLPMDVRPAYLHLALVPGYLAVMSRPGFDPFRDVVGFAQWRRQITLWRAARGS